MTVSPVRRSKRADLRRRDVDVVGPGQVVVVGRAQEAEAVGQDLEHALGEDQAALLGLRLEDLEDQLLLAHAGDAGDLEVAWRSWLSARDAHLLQLAEIEVSALVQGARRRCLGRRGSSAGGAPRSRPAPSVRSAGSRCRRSSGPATPAWTSPLSCFRPTARRLVVFVARGSLAGAFRCRSAGAPAWFPASSSRGGSGLIRAVRFRDRLPKFFHSLAGQAENQTTRHPGSVRGCASGSHSVLRLSLSTLVATTTQGRW